MLTRQAIFIFGMGRSGTSALARVLSMCGAWLPDQLLGPNDGNPKGHWEPLEALRLNEEFLAANGSTYYDPSLRLQDDGSLDGADKDAFIDRIAAFLDSVPHARPAVIKEPRIVALADFWFEAARRSSIDVKIIIPVRRPSEVAASLAKRDGTSFELSNALWLKYNLLAERHSRMYPRVFVEYSSVLADCPRQISRISEALSVRFENRDDDAIREFLTHDLHRQRGDELTEAFGSSWVGDVYAAFSAAANGARPDIDKLDEVFLSYSASERTFRTAINEFRNKHSGYHWASDLKPFLARVVDECSSEIARRFGDAIPPDEMPVDPIRMPFDYQADRVTGVLESVAGQGAQLKDAYAKLAAYDIQLQDARSTADTVRTQLLEVNANLAESRSELATSRDLAEINAASEERLERAVREAEAALDAQRAASQDRIAQLISLISTLRTQIATHERSHSWRITSPLRAFRRGRRRVSTPSSLDEELSAMRLPFASEANASLRREPTPVERNLAAGGAEENTLPDGFDRIAYLSLNPDVAASGIDPAHHYLSCGREEGRAFCFADAPAAPAGVSTGLPKGFDPDAYLALNPDVAASAMDPRYHYLSYGRKEGRTYARSDRGSAADDVSSRLPQGFDPDAYLELNPDLLEVGVEAITHYLQHGRLEGRAYLYPDLEMSGTHHMRADRDSVLVVSHEASRTGAPMVGLNLVSNLAGRYNVVALLLGDGPLVDSFEQAGAVTIVSHLRRHPVIADSVIGRLHDQFRFRFAFVNSIESRIVLKALGVRFVPVVSLVHEFAAYTRPPEAFPEALLWSSEAVFSANITRQSVLEHTECADARSLHTIPQGRCVALGPQGIDKEFEDESERLRHWIRPGAPGDGPVIVLGAGAVHLRKGVDLFIEIAARVVSAPGASHCRFVWLGSGYDPEGDVHYSAYLADQIQRAGLEDYVFFAGETRAIETAYREADIFLMSSRLDPMPNVAIDALTHGKPVLCFDKSTGIADFLKDCGLADRCVARYLDTGDMADKIQTLASSKSLRQEVGEKGRHASTSYFNMTDYVIRLDDLAQRAVGRSKREAEDVDLIVDSGLYRPDFGVPPQMPSLSIDAAVRLHVRSWASGIRRRKPFSGFHPGVYLEQHGIAVEDSDPTADYIRAGRPQGHWNSPVISAEVGDARELPANESVALHLHVFYPDLLPDIMARLSSNRCRPDLLVSVTNEEAKDLVARHLERYEGKVAALELVPNRGRDIGPLLTQFGRRILSEYAYVGHIHTKKTEAVKDAALGKTWFEFLLTNLLGGRSGAMADAILASMNADRTLGMVFPDDPHAQGWNANRGIAEALASKIGIKELPQHFSFPVGTMFWARTCALSPLINLNLQWDDYPQEPLPYDGTLLHAIERLLPLTLQGGTLRAAVTNVTGVTR